MLFIGTIIIFFCIFVPVTFNEFNSFNIFSSCSTNESNCIVPSIELPVLNLYSVNFFRCNKKQYDIVYSKRALHREEYMDIPMEQKIEALKDAVKKDGIMYLEYLMWLDDDNSDNLNPNQYIKQCQMQNYFTAGWKILSLVEDRKCILEKPHIGNPIYHKHRVGMIKVRKNKSSEKKYYNINMIFN